jgi:hypothetical protein
VIPWHSSTRQSAVLPVCARSRAAGTAGEFDRAAKVWAKANRESRNELNQEWSERRNDFCLMQNMRERRKAVDDELSR